MIYIFVNPAKIQPLISNLFLVFSRFQFYVAGDSCFFTMKLVESNATFTDPLATCIPAIPLARLSCLKLGV